MALGRDGDPAGWVIDGLTSAGLCIRNCGNVESSEFDNQFKDIWKQETA